MKLLNLPEFIKLTAYTFQALFCSAVSLDKNVFTHFPFGEDN